MVLSVSGRRRVLLNSDFSLNYESGHDSRTIRPKSNQYLLNALLGTIS